MKQLVPGIMSLVFLSMLSTALFAQQYPGGGPGPGPRMQDGRDSGLTPEQFKDQKARIVQMIAEREKRLAQEKACVEASTTMEEMRACRPELRMPRGQGGMTGRPGQQRMPREGMDMMR